MKRRVWKGILGGIAGLALAAGAFVWDAQRRATAVFRRHDALATEAIAVLRARPAFHPVLFEPALEGDGWADYESALVGFAAMADADANELPSIRNEPGTRSDPEQVERVLLKYEPLVEKLRDSARRPGFVPTYRYEDGWRMDLNTVSSVLRTARFLSDRARYLHEQHRDAEALDTLLLGLALGNDAARLGPMVNLLFQHVCEEIQEDCLRELLAEHSFQAADLRRFAEGLDRLWAARPSLEDAMVADEALLRRSLADYGLLGTFRQDVDRDFVHRSWRYLFSTRLAFAGALGEIDQLTQRTRALAVLPVRERIDAARKLTEEARGSRNPVVSQLHFPMSRSYLTDAWAHSGWQLMRVAVAIAWFESERGAPPEALGELVPRYLPAVPLCPASGKPLGYRDGRVWSVGENGVDDGGVPGQDNTREDRDGDYVWRVRRE